MFSKIIVFILFSFVSLFSYAEIVSDDATTIEIMESICVSNKPQKLCKCISEGMRSSLSSSSISLKEIMNSKIEGITSSCMISTGIIKNMKDKMVVSCYTNEEESIESDAAYDVRIKQVKSDHPEKLERCECFASEIYQVSDLDFLNASREAFSNFQKKVKCRTENPGDDCSIYDAESFVSRAEKKCAK